MEFFNIQVAAQISGVSAHTIRAWEKRYQALTPKRSENGRRLYSEEDIQRLTLLSKLTQFGSSIGQIANLPDEQLQKLIGKFSKNTDNLVSTKPTIQTSQIDPQQVLTNLFMGLSVFKLDIIYHELQKAQQELSAHDMVFKVLLPFFKKCKSMNLTSIQEKTLFTLVKFEVSKMVHRHYMKPQRMNKKIILAACEKDLQSIELLCAAILCTQHSVELVYFDNYIPAESLALISQTMGAHIIMLGSSTEGSSNLVEFSEQLQNHINEKTHLWMTSNKAQEKFKFMSNSQIHFFPALENLEQKLNEISQNV